MPQPLRSCRSCSSCTVPPFHACAARAGSRAPTQDRPSLPRSVLRRARVGQAGAADGAHPGSRRPGVLQHHQATLRGAVAGRVRRSHLEHTQQVRGGLLAAPQLVTPASCSGYCWFWAALHALGEWPRRSEPHEMPKHRHDSLGQCCGFWRLCTPGTRFEKEDTRDASQLKALKPLGSGAFGVAWLVQHSNQRTYALKVLNKDAMKQRHWADVHQQGCIHGYTHNIDTAQAQLLHPLRMRLGWRGTPGGRDQAI